MFYSTNFAATPGTAEQCYTYFSGYGYDPGYYVNGPPGQFTFQYFPFLAVIDLNTGVLVGKDYNTGDTDYLTPGEIVALVQAANAE